MVNNNSNYRHEIKQAAKSYKRDAQASKVECINEIENIQQDKIDSNLPMQDLDQYLSSTIIEGDNNHNDHQISKYINILSKLIQQRANIINNIAEIQQSKKAHIELMFHQHNITRIPRQE